MPFTDRESQLAYFRDYYRKHRESRREDTNRRARAYNKTPKRKAWAQEYIRKNPERRLLVAATRRAKVRGIECTITLADIVIPDCCPVFGFKLEPKLNFYSGISSGGAPNSPSLDRIDNSKGYIPGNVRVISFLANAMKGAATREQLLQFAEWILATCKP